jgi:hypothetical protein
MGSLQMKSSTLGAAVAIVGLLAVRSAGAATLTFVDRGAFVIATGSMSLETFDSFNAEASFADAPLVVGDLTLSSFGRQLGGALIDLAPHQFATQNINGTPNASVTTFTDSGFDIAFSHAVTAFGATFADLQDRALRTHLLVAGETLAPPIQQADGVTFFGFISSTPFTHIRFIGTGNPEGDGFALDDLLFGDPNPATGGGVPEPASWTLMIAGLGLTGGMLRRRTATARLGRSGSAQ